MIVVFEVIYAIISAILILLGFITLRAIKHLGVGKPFWIPVIASSIFFLIGSLATVLYELGFSILVQTAEIVQIIRIAALCILVCGIYSYSRRIKTSLREDFPTSQQKIKEMFEAEALSKEASHIDTSSPERIVHENTMHKSKEVDVAPECTHHFGYLKTLSKNAPVPIECLSCNRIIMCKHSLVTSLESPARS